MTKSMMVSLTGAACMALLLGSSLPAHAQTDCTVRGQQGGSFIGGGTVPFTVQSTGKMNCKGLNKPDTTSQLEFLPQSGCNTTRCPGSNVCEYPLANGSFVMSQANSGSPSGKLTTTISGTYDPASSFVCFDFNNTPATTSGSFAGTIVGGTGAWDGAAGNLSVVATGQIVQAFGNGINQMSFTANFTGLIAH